MISPDRLASILWGLDALKAYLQANYGQAASEGILDAGTGTAKVAAPEDLRVISAFRFSDGTRLVFTRHGLMPIMAPEVLGALATDDTRYFHVDVVSGIVQYLKAEEW